jgi:hypothetical protein
MDMKKEYEAACAANDDAQCREIEDQADAWAYEIACERVSPNSIEFAALHERLIDELLGA